MLALAGRVSQYIEGAGLQGPTTPQNGAKHIYEIINILNEDGKLKTFVNQAQEINEMRPYAIFRTNPKSILWFILIVTGILTVPCIYFWLV